MEGRVGAVPLNGVARASSPMGVAQRRAGPRERQKERRKRGERQPRQPALCLRPSCYTTISLGPERERESPPPPLALLRSPSPLRRPPTPARATDRDRRGERRERANIRGSSGRYARVSRPNRTLHVASIPLPPLVRARSPPSHLSLHVLAFTFSLSLSAAVSLFYFLPMFAYRMTRVHLSDFVALTLIFEGTKSRDFWPWMES